MAVWILTDVSFCSFRSAIISSKDTYWESIYEYVAAKACKIIRARNLLAEDIVLYN